MTVLLVLGGLALVGAVVALAAVRVGRDRDPLDSLGPVEGHRAIPTEECRDRTP